MYNEQNLPLYSLFLGALAEDSTEYPGLAFYTPVLRTKPLRRDT